MCARYGNYLKSKYMQVSHHGLAINATGNLYIRRNNSTKELYGLIAPETVFWPAPEYHIYGRADDESTPDINEKVPSRLSCEVNKYLADTFNPTIINASSSAADRTITVK
jgi:hypothetical protein